MKKVYQKPSARIFNIEIQSLMNVVSDGNGNVNSVGVKGDYDGRGTLSRGRGRFFDDEED